MSPPSLVLALVVLVTSLPAVTFVTPARSAPAALDDELILKFRAGITAEQKTGLLASIGAIGTQDLGRTGAVRVRLADRVAAQVVSSLAGDPALEYAEPNFVCSATLIPNDTFFAQQWALRNTGQSGGTPGADIRACDAWDICTGSPDVVIGVLDSGIDFAHPDLAPNLYTNPGEIPGNGLDDDANGFVDDVHGWDFVNEDNDPSDDNGHGTFMSGLAGAVGNDNTGIAGVCWHARLLPLKFLTATGSGTTANAIRALDYAAALGVPITNNSWGGGGFSQAVLDAIVAADKAGTRFVVSAGRTSTDLDVNPQYPACYDVPNVIVVAGTDDDDLFMTQSNYGVATVDLAAPGTDILTTWPGGAYRVMTGTSASTAFVSGGLALVMAAFPDLSPEAAAAHMMDKVQFLPSLVGKVRTEGRLDLWRPLAEAPAAGVQDRADPAGRPRIWCENPGRGTVRLGISVPRDGAATIRVLDVRGRLVCRLHQGFLAAGRHERVWDGRAGDGLRAPSGVYWVHVETADGSAASRVAMVR